MLPGVPDRLLIVGMGRSGVAAARAARRVLPAAGVTLADSREDALSADVVAELVALGIHLDPGRQDDGLLDGFSSQNSLVIKSPGVPGSVPLLEEARRRGLTVWGEVEFARRWLPNIFVGVTGTNGKTTTTMLIAHILKNAGRPCRVAGNVGTALSSLVGETPAGEILVVELSSFQLEDSIDLRPDIAVLLNLSEDHLDRHPDAAGYYAAKQKIFANQVSGDLAVINHDDPRCRGPLSGGARVLWFSRQGEPAGPPAASAFFQAGNIMAATAAIGRAARDLRARMAIGRTPPASGEIIPKRAEAMSANGAKMMADITGPSEVVMAWSDAGLIGTHNLENALAATAVCLSLGLEPDKVAAGLASFPGVPHRLQIVRELAGVLFVNDSKATNVDAAAKALGAFTRPVHLILGGSLKGCSFKPLAEAIAKASVRQVLAIGEAAPRIAADLKDSAIEVSMAQDLKTALRRASEKAIPGDVVLLAPACASFDQYQDYEQRGDHFISLVEQLREV